MPIALKPLPYKKAGQLSKLISEKIKESQHLYKDKIEVYNKTLKQPKKELIEYFKFMNDKDYCITTITKGLPDWLEEFLSDCHVKSHQEIYNDK